MGAVALFGAPCRIRGGRTRSRAIVISTSISTARLRGQCKVHEKPLTTVVTWERFLARAPPMDFV